MDFSECLSIAAVRLATRRRLFRHTWALASFMEVVASDSPVSHFSVTSPAFPRDSILLTLGGLIVLQRMSVVSIVGSTGNDTL